MGTKSIKPVKSVGAVLDKEIGKAEEDAFGHRHYAKLLRRLIEEPTHEPPFSIGLLGSWGTGKSSIKKIYEKELESDVSSEDGKLRKNRIRTITFNAWRYGGDVDLKRALLRQVFLELGGDEKKLRQELYDQVTEETKKRASATKILKDASKQLWMSVLLLLCLLAGTLGLVWGFVYLVGLEDFSAASVALVAVAATGWLAKHLLDLRVNTSAWYSPITTISLPTTSAEEYERLLVEQLKTFKQSNGRECQRLVIFVDDLDRLSAQEMVSGLDAIRTFLEIPISPDGAGGELGVVFVISCDEDRVADALNPQRGGRRNPEQPGAVLNRVDSRRYLDRLFQFRLEIPQFPNLDMRSFAANKLKDVETLLGDLEATGVRIEQVVERLIHPGVQSPRNALQILNAFLQSWWIAKEREAEARGGSEREGLLYDGAVTKHPLSLAALCVLQADFPSFFEELQRRPQLISEFQKLLFGGMAYSDLPPVSQHALAEYIDHIGDGKIDVKPEARPLRRYLASLQDLRWAERLGPILLLADDPVTRKYGEQDESLYRDFVAGDVSGVLETLRRHLDNKDLPQNDVKLLQRLNERANDDTEERKRGASRVIATLASRISAEHSPALMTSLARRMVEDKTIRMNVTPELAIEVIADVSAADRQAVASVFMRDLLLGEDIEWRHRNGEDISLDELGEVVKDATDLVLDVLLKDGLSPSDQELFKAWLLRRDFTLKDNGLSLPFSDLEGWLSRCGPKLLDLLSEEYIDAAASAIDTDKDLEVSSKDVLRRFASVHDNLASKGEQSRSILWSQLPRLVKLETSWISEYAWNKGVEYIDYATPVQLSVFMTEFSDRLVKDMERDGSEDQWRVNREAGGEAFVKLIQTCGGELSNASLKSIEDLPLWWAWEDECTSFFIESAEVLRRHGLDVWQNLMSNIVSAEEKLWDLPNSALKYLGEKIGSFAEKDRSLITQTMNQCIQQDAIGEDQRNGYQHLANSVPVECWREPMLAEHVTSLFEQTRTKSADLEYLKVTLSLVIKLLEAAPSNISAEFLENSFQNARNSVDSLPYLSEKLVGHWPPMNEQIGTYNAAQIVNICSEFVSGHSEIEGVGTALETLFDMARRDVISNEEFLKIISAVRTSWAHHASTAISGLKFVSKALTAEDVSDLLERVDEAELGSYEISQLVILARESIAPDGIEQITKSILDEPSVMISNEPDAALRFWLSGETESALELRRWICEPELTDDQAERVVAIALDRSDELGLEFFVDTIRGVLSLQSKDRAVTAMVEGLGSVVKLAHTGEDKSKLAKLLIGVLPYLRAENVGKVGRQIQQLGGKAELDKTQGVVDQLNIDQLKQLGNAVPDSANIKKAIGVLEE